jgi:hypothetical protein
LKHFPNSLFYFLKIKKEKKTCLEALFLKTVFKNYFGFASFGIKKLEELNCVLIFTSQF